MTDLSQARNALLLGVGGGNDSVTSLMAMAQLAVDAGFRPERLQVAAMLPDVLAYTGMETAGQGIAIIGPNSRRWVSGKPMDAFPEPLLAAHRDRFGIERVLGLRMDRGSDGIVAALAGLIAREGIDLVLACDVGGDFIAAPDNLDVLSPMMDAYALSALRRLHGRVAGTRFAYCVFGLGTDGEATPRQLRDALARAPARAEGRFDPDAIAGPEEFYRAVVEQNRYSRTADFTLRSIHGEALPPSPFRARFHTQPAPGQSKRYYGTFTQELDPEFAGRYYLFESLDGVANPFERACASGLEWYLDIQRVGPGMNHELNGQSYARIADAHEGGARADSSMFFGTPSRRFTAEQRAKIARDIASSVASGAFDSALVCRGDLECASWDGLAVHEVSDGLALVTGPADAARIRTVIDAVVTRLQQRQSS